MVYANKFAKHGGYIYGGLKIIVVNIHHLSKFYNLYKNGLGIIVEIKILYIQYYIIYLNSVCKIMFKDLL